MIRSRPLGVHEKRYYYSWLNQLVLYLKADRLPRKFVPIHMGYGCSRGSKILAGAHVANLGSVFDGAKKKQSQKILPNENVGPL
jgi:hypothetical protein